MTVPAASAYRTSPRREPSEPHAIAHRDAVPVPLLWIGLWGSFHWHHWGPAVAGLLATIAAIHWLDERWLVQIRGGSLLLLVRRGQRTPHPIANIPLTRRATLITAGEHVRVIAQRQITLRFAKPREARKAAQRIGELLKAERVQTTTEQRRGPLYDPSALDTRHVWTARLGLVIHMVLLVAWFHWWVS